MAATLADEVSPRKPDLVGLTEIQELLAQMGKVNPDSGEPLRLPRVAALTERKDFPKPVLELAKGRFWQRSQVVKWAESWTRKPGRPWPRKEGGT